MKLSKLAELLLLVSFSVLAIGCGQSGGNNNETIPIDDSNQSPTPVYANPRAVTISGYDGDAMEPYISRDGSTLFFNNLNASTLSNGDENDTNIHYATRIDDFTFEYIGPVIGASEDNIMQQNELEGVPTMDSGRRFYFIRTIDYLDNTSEDYLRSIYSADYANGSLTNIQSVANLRTDRQAGEAPVPGELNFDVEIHQGGQVLYFVQGIFSGNAFPDEANIGIANKDAEEFIVDAASDDLFEQINTNNLEYAAAISANQLELYFTRASGNSLLGFDFEILVATRDSLSEPWQTPVKIEAIQGEVTEGPSITADGALLYYHQKVDGIFQIFVVSRQ